MRFAHKCMPNRNTSSISCIWQHWFQTSYPYQSHMQQLTRLWNGVQLCTAHTCPLTHSHQWQTEQLLPLKLTWLKHLMTVWCRWLQHLWVWHPTSQGTQTGSWKRAPRTIPLHLGLGRRNLSSFRTKSYHVSWPLTTTTLSMTRFHPTTTPNCIRQSNDLATSSPCCRIVLLAETKPRRSIGWPSTSLPATRHAQQRPTPIRSTITHHNKTLFIRGRAVTNSRADILFRLPLGTFYRGAFLALVLRRAPKVSGLTNCCRWQISGLCIDNCDRKKAHVQLTGDNKKAFLTFFNEAICAVTTELTRANPSSCNAPYNKALIRLLRFQNTTRRLRPSNHHIVTYHHHIISNSSTEHGKFFFTSRSKFLSHIRAHTNPSSS